jgi:hypothetical protein
MEQFNFAKPQRKEKGNKKRRRHMHSLELGNRTSHRMRMIWHDEYRQVESDFNTHHQRVSKVALHARKIFTSISHPLTEEVSFLVSRTNCSICYRKCGSKVTSDYIVFFLLLSSLVMIILTSFPPERRHHCVTREDVVSV